MEETTERNIEEILSIMRNNQKYFQTGLCQWAYAIYHHGLISPQEHQKLMAYIKGNRPSAFSSISALDCRMRTSKYYWERAVISYRLKWLDKHIQIQK